MEVRTSRNSSYSNDDNVDEIEGRGQTAAYVKFRTLPIEDIGSAYAA